MAKTDLPPLPRTLGRAVLEELGRDGVLPSRANPGLVFERYPRCWDMTGPEWTLGKDRKDFLSRFAEAYEGLQPSHEPLLTARIDALDRALGKGRDFQARWRFVSGVGSEHPLENGFTFHRLLGVPYFPGSTVKGLARAAARASRIDKEDERRLFGPAPPHAEERDPASTGELVFHDALPVTWPKLDVDLVNNHRPTWTNLSNSGAKSLGDAARASAAGLEDPVPVAFLAVEPGVKLRFWIRARARLGDQEHDLNRAWEWLEDGLRYLGIGAKTAVGYGRFSTGIEA